MNTLYDLRVTTPRLELRLASEGELTELFHVAEAGIHPPEEMPFAVPWTDDLQLDAFLDHHRSAIAGWSPDAWNLSLIVFFDGRAVGNQALRAKRFAETRLVNTGSWLGRAYQRRGLGTEMRVGALELAFRGLGAETAESGAMLGNEGSAGVSRKLGYRHSGWSEISPRGEPLQHEDLRLDRADWRPPVPVEIEHLERALPLFGV